MHHNNLFYTPAQCQVSVKLKVPSFCPGQCHASAMPVPGYCHTSASQALVIIKSAVNFEQAASALVRVQFSFIAVGTARYMMRLAIISQIKFLINIFQRKVLHLRQRDT